MVQYKVERYRRQRPEPKSWAWICRVLRAGRPPNGCSSTARPCGRGWSRHGRSSGSTCPGTPAESGPTWPCDCSRSPRSPAEPRPGGCRPQHASAGQQRETTFSQAPCRADKGVAGAGVDVQFLSPGGFPDGSEDAVACAFVAAIGQHGQPLSAVEQASRLSCSSCSRMVLAVLSRVSGRLWSAKAAGSGFRRCHVCFGGVACVGEFGGGEDRDGQSDQDRAENPGGGEWVA